MFRRVAVLGVALVVLGVATAVALAGGNANPAGRVAAVRTPLVTAKSSFAVFRRSPRTSDAIKRTGRRARKANIVGTTRLVLTEGAVEVFALDGQDGRVCLLYHDASSGLGASTCTSTEQATTGGRPPALSLVGASKTDVYMLVPDGVSTVRMHNADGSAYDVAVRDNVVSAHTTPMSASWTGADGVEHVAGDLAPSLPASVRAALANGQR